jgi:ubiquitin-conjugating enzyme E2 variant
MSPGRPKWIVCTEVAGLSAFVGLCATRFDEFQLSYWELAAGYAAADVASGITHWFADNFFAEDTPILGPLLIYPFRDHHRDPLAITRHSLVELLGNSALALLPVLLLPISAALLLSFSSALLVTNLLHRWAHAAQPPSPIRRLQRLRLILSPESHQLHHISGDRAYCVTSGWMNPLLDRLLRKRLPAET